MKYRSNMFFTKTLGLLKKIFPILFGIGLIFVFYRSTTVEQKQRLWAIIVNAHLIWVLFSICLGVLAHYLRALRWKWSLEVLKYHPSVFNLFCILMCGYLSNLGIPRSGEVLRCALIQRYEQVSFNNALGSIIAERVLDIIMLLLCLGITTVYYYDLMLLLLKQYDPLYYILGFFTLLTVAVLGVIVLKKLNISFLSKITSMGNEVLRGILAIRDVKSPFAFVLVTLVIWVLYFLMSYCVSFSLEGLFNVDIGVFFIAFIVGTISMTVTSGGIGVLPYPLAVASVFVLFGIETSIGEAYGWLVWSGQTLLNIVVGILSFVFLSLCTIKKSKHTVKFKMF